MKRCANFALLVAFLTAFAGGFVCDLHAGPHHDHHHATGQRTAAFSLADDCTPPAQLPAVVSEKSWSSPAPTALAHGFSAATTPLATAIASALYPAAWSAMASRPLHLVPAYSVLRI